MSSDVSHEPGARSRVTSWQDPLIGAQAAKSLSGLAYLQAMIDGKLPPPPIAMLMGLRLASVEPGRAVFQVTPGEFHYNPIGSVHGGLLATIADSALGCAIHTTLPAGVGYTTIELHTNFLRAITVGTGEITCAAEVIHAGGRIATAQAKVFDAAGKLYGHATTTCMILRPQSAKAGEQP